MPKSPYSGGRSLVALAQRVDEDALVRRYAENNWSVPQCAKAFGISDHRVRAILRSHGVELRGQRKELDPDAVLRAYAQFGNYTAVAQLLGTSTDRIRQILDEKGVQHDSPRKVAGYDNKSGRKAARRRRLSTEPSPADLLSPSEAAQISGKSTTQLRVLTRQGQLSNYGNEYFPRYRRSDAQALAHEPERKAPITNDGRQRRPGQVS
jgi:phage antirepressor YoqD-like protein